MPISRNEELQFSQSHAFVIGINNYPNLSSNLDTAVDDARDIAMRLKVYQGFDNVLLMIDPSKEQIIQLLNWLEDNDRPPSLLIEDETHKIGTTEYSSEISWLKLESEMNEENSDGHKTLTLNTEAIEGFGDAERIYQVKQSICRINPMSDNDTDPDSIVFYYAGHGFPRLKSGGPAGYLAPTDANNQQLEGDQSLIPMESVYAALSGANCRHTLLILDCCYSGKFKFVNQQQQSLKLDRGEEMTILMPLYERLYNRYKEGIAWQVLVSAGPNQPAMDSAEWAGIRENSPFTKTLMDALEGQADALTFGNKSQGDGIITAGEIISYVRNKVEDITEEYRIQHPNLLEMSQHDTGQFIFLNPDLLTNNFTFASDDPDETPYKGLVPYEIEDANIFYGRDKAIKGILKKITFQKAQLEKPTEKKSTPSVIFLTAPSAAGKSSLAKAGVFPSLQKKYGYEELLVFRPGAPNNIQGQSVMPDEEEYKGVYKKEEWTGITELLKRLDTKKKQMVLVDQFEEFFTDMTNEEREQLEDSLIQIIEDPAELREQPLVILFTMRSDVEWRMPKTRLGGRKEDARSNRNYWIKDHIFRLQPMSFDELRAALTHPAQSAMYDFKDSRDGNATDMGEKLIGQILKDVFYYPAPLPWLSCVMEAFFDKAKENGDYKLTEEDYKGLDGVEGAMSMKAETFYKEFIENATGNKEKKRQLFEAVMLRMVKLDDSGYSGRKVTYSEPSSDSEEAAQTTDDLYELDYGEDNQLLKELIDEMGNRFLLVQGKKDDKKQTTVEPAHAALINYWPRCMELIEDFGKDKLLLQREIWDAVLKYHTAKKDQDKDEKKELWDENLRLPLLMEDLKNNKVLNSSEKAFLGKSNEVRKQKEQPVQTKASNKVIKNESVKSSIYKAKPIRFNTSEITFLTESEKLKTKNKRRTQFIVAAVMIGLFALSLFAFFQAKEAVKQRKEAEKQTDIARDQKIKAEKQTEIAKRQTKIAQEETEKTKKAQENEKKSNYDKFISEGWAALKSLELAGAEGAALAAKRIDSTRNEAKELLDNIKLKKGNKIAFDRLIRKADSLARSGLPNLEKAFQSYEESFLLEVDTNMVKGRIFDLQIKSTRDMEERIKDAEAFFKTQTCPGYQLARKNYSEADSLIKVLTKETKEEHGLKIKNGLNKCTDQIKMKKCEPN